MFENMHVLGVEDYAEGVLGCYACFMDEEEVIKLSDKIFADLRQEMKISEQSENKLSGLVKQFARIPLPSISENGKQVCVCVRHVPTVVLSGYLLTLSAYLSACVVCCWFLCVCSSLLVPLMFVFFCLLPLENLRNSWMFHSPF